MGKFPFIIFNSYRTKSKKRDREKKNKEPTRAGFLVRLTGAHDYQQHRNVTAYHPDLHCLSRIFQMLSGILLWHLTLFGSDYCFRK